jgi:hypothetical protein
MREWTTSYLIAPLHRWIFSRFALAKRFDAPRRTIALARTCLRPKADGVAFDVMLARVIASLKQPRSLIDHGFLTELATSLVGCINPNLRQHITKEPQLLCLLRTSFNPAILPE